MKVAIIGAGHSGMACAHELKRQGITPVIYEKKSYLGEVLEFPVIGVHMFNTPIRDPLKYLEKKYSIKLTPHYNLREIIMKSQNITRSVTGNLGYIFRRDKIKDSFVNQIASGEDIDVKFNSLVNINDIRMQYDHVVVSIGSIQITKEMNNYLATFRAQARIAKVKGDFKTDSITVWFNTDYAKTGFGYLVASTEKEAYLILIVPNITPKELNYYWDKFIAAEKIKNKIINFQDITHEVGFVSPVQLGNVYFTGIAGGFIDDLLGFGSIKAVLSGVSAGYAIANSHSYTDLMKPFIKDIQDKHEYRRALDSFTNDDIGKLIKLLALPGIKQFIYNNPLLNVNQGTFLARIFNKIKERGK